MKPAIIKAFYFLLFFFILNIQCVQWELTGGYPKSQLFNRMTLETITESPLVTVSFNEEINYYYQILIQNLREYPVSFYPYYTPMEGVFSDFFDFFYKEDNRTKAEYVGPVATRRFPPPESVKLTWHRGAEAEKFVKEIEITKIYAFPQDGIYRARYSTIQIEHNNTLKRDVLHFASSTSRQLKVFQTENYVPYAYVNPLSEETTYQSCTDAQTETISKAITTAKSMIKQAIQYLEGADHLSSSAFTDTFGDEHEEMLASNKNYVLQVYQKMLAATPSVIECVQPTAPEDELDPIWADRGDEASCKQNTGITTWLLPRDRSKTVHVCPDFFDLTEKMNPFTIISALVRFDEVGAGKSYADGFSFARELPKLYPSSVCIKNAESYSLFVKRIFKTETLRDRSTSVIGDVL